MAHPPPPAPLNRRLDRRGFGLLVTAGLVMAGTTPAADCTRLALPGFSLCLPPGWQHLPGAGTDSTVGSLRGPGLEIQYDLGLYSDPLREPEGAADFQARPAELLGRPVRWVRYRLNREGRTWHLLGLHVPEVRRSRMGPLRLTLLARTAEAERVEAATAILGSLGLPAR
jgi:hypothetical protein